MEIADSARKHGITDEDIRHAVRHAIVEREHFDQLLVIGADRAGRMLEVVVLDHDSELDDPVVIHAMRLRRAFAERLGWWR